MTHPVASTSIAALMRIEVLKDFFDCIVILLLETFRQRFVHRQASGRYWFIPTQNPQRKNPEGRRGTRSYKFALK
jgi:hypothetical protein